MKNRQIIIIIAAAALAVGITSCAPSRKVERSVEIPIRLEKAEYDIVGTFRKKTRRGTYTYDVILRDARKKYGKDVDIVNIKVDKKRKKAIVNGYVIRYK